MDLVTNWKYDDMESLLLDFHKHICSEGCSDADMQCPLAWRALVVFYNRVSGITFPILTASD